MPCRRRNANIGRQYVRQSFSSASCAAGDSPCASSTTLQWVVVNATPWCCPLASLAGVDVTSWGAALTVRWNQEIAPKASLHGDDTTRPNSHTICADCIHRRKKAALAFCLLCLSSRLRCVNIDAPWLCDCLNKIIRTSSASLRSTLFAPRRRLL